MPKLQNVTNEELEAINNDALDLLGRIHDAANRMEKSYVDTVSAPLDKARSMVSLARGALNLNVALSMKARMDEQKRELDALMRERDAQAAK